MEAAEATKKTMTSGGEKADRGPLGRLLLTAPIDVIYFASKFAGAGTRTADEQGIFSAYCFLGQRKYPH